MAHPEADTDELSSSPAPDSLPSSPNTDELSSPPAPPPEPSPRTLSRSALVAALAPLASPRPRWQNWGRTFLCRPLALFAPSTPYHCRLALELAARDARRLRPLGLGHSPSDVACSSDYMLLTTRLNRVLRVDVPNLCVTAEAGITLLELHDALRVHGLAMRNLGSISDQTLAGIVATGTHGSGVAFGVMSTHVLSLTLLLPSNEIVRCSPTERPDLFTATICGLGATGLIMTITLEVERAFRLKDTHTVRPFADVVQDAALDALSRSGEHVRLWWFPAAGVVRCMVADRTQEPAAPAGSWFWDSLVGFHAVQLLLLLARYARLEPLAWLAYLSCLFSPLLSLFSRLFVQVFNIECRYRQHTTEWALPAARAGACLRALGRWLEGEMGEREGERPHFPIEVRFSAADDIWLSPSSGGLTCWIGIVQYKPYNLPTRYRKLFATFERILAEHGGRPHWAKAHHLDARATRALYPNFGRFLEVVEEVDPAGIFRNEYIERHLMGGAGDGREYKVYRGSGRVERRRAALSSSSPAASSSLDSRASPSSSRWWQWPWGRAGGEAVGEGDWREDWRVAPPPLLEEGLEGQEPDEEEEVEEDASSESSDADSEATLAGAGASPLLAGGKIAADLTDDAAPPNAAELPTL
ncbi:D-arabinono-1,4-lactone oxidase-domain-containing protein [Mycena vulgaris]|nr:D-arabinono-1,4-lactone oxidase-domain-containing protein [Mycena vulgaris]